MGGARLHVFFVDRLTLRSSHNRLSRTMVGRGGAADWHAMCVHVYCVYVRVCLIGCVLEQVSQVDVPWLRRAL